MTGELRPCGTHAAYQRHLRRGETPCDPCRAASAAYQRTYRQQPGVKERNRASKAAAERALWRLAARHRSEFYTLRVDEQMKLDDGNGAQ